MNVPKYAIEMARIHHSLPSNMRSQHGPIVVACNLAFGKAMAFNHAHAANSLRHMAKAKAKKIEVATLALNTVNGKLPLVPPDARARAPGPAVSLTDG